MTAAGRMTARVAARLPTPPDGLELDVDREADLGAVARSAQRALRAKTGGAGGPPSGSS